jgi:hypothetical protein
LSEPGEFETGLDIASRFVMALGFAGIEQAAFNGAGDTDDQIDLMSLC